MSRGQSVFIRFFFARSLHLCCRTLALELAVIQFRRSPHRQYYEVRLHFPEEVKGETGLSGPPSSTSPLSTLSPSVEGVEMGVLLRMSSFDSTYSSWASPWTSSSYRTGYIRADKIRSADSKDPSSRDEVCFKKEQHEEKVKHNRLRDQEKPLELR